MNTFIGEEKALGFSLSFSIQCTSGQVGPKCAGQDSQSPDNIVAPPLKWYNYSRIKQRKGMFI